MAGATLRGHVEHGVLLLQHRPTYTHLNTTQIRTYTTKQTRRHYRRNSCHLHHGQLHHGQIHHSAENTHPHYHTVFIAH